ncbi:hypothetical protein JXA84_06095 [candidate division WOR-3 bacterium]|nr:hypothetical protein [candidate division WOR-3 bacterium]
MIFEKITEKQNAFSVKIQQSEISGVKKTNDTKTGMRVYDAGRLGIYGEIGANRDEEKLKKRAVEALDIAIDYPFEPASEIEETWQFTGENLSDMDFIEGIKSLLEKLKNKHPKFTFSNSISTYTFSNEMSNERGLKLHYKDELYASILFFKEKCSSNILDGYSGYIGRTFNPTEMLRITDILCSNYLVNADIKLPDKYPVVFLSSDISEFSFFSHHLNGLNIGTKTSSISSKIKEKLFNEKFTLLQTKDPNFTYSVFFDSEGTVNPNYETPLVEKGVFLKPYTDKRTSARFGFENTGSANFQYDGAPLLATPPFRALPTDKNLKDIIGDEKAIFVYIKSGGDFTPDGFYASPVQLAYLFENGQIKGKLPQIQIKSNAFDMFGNSFLGVSEEKFSALGSENFFVAEMDVFEL